MTVDGVIRTFSIGEREMIRQYRLADIVPAAEGPIHWFEARGKSMTVGSEW